MNEAKKYGIIVELIKSRKRDFVGALLSNAVHNADYTQAIFDSIGNNQILKSKCRDKFLPKTVEAFMDISFLYQKSMTIIQHIMLSDQLLSLFENEVNLYLEKRSQYERLLYKGKYKDAESVIDRIEKDVCISLWSLSQRLLLSEFMGGLEKNKQLLQSYQSIKPKNLLLLVLLDYSSLLAEEKTSYANYQDKLTKYLEVFKQDSPVKSYLFNKYSLDGRTTTMGHNCTLQIDAQISIVDWYNSFIDAVVSQDIPSDICLRHSEKIHDCVLDNLCFLNNNVEISRRVYTNRNDGLLGTIDTYSAGDYINTIRQLSILAENNADDFQLLVMLVKSLVFNVGKGKKIEDFDGVDNLLFEDVMNIYLLNDATKQALQRLQNLQKRYHFCTIRPKLASFIQRKCNSTIDYQLLIKSFCHDKFLYPNIVYALGIFSTNNQYASILEEYMPTTFQYYAICTHQKGTRVSEIKIDKERFLYYSSKAYLSEGNVPDALKSLELLKKTLFDVNNYSRERYYRALFETFRVTGNTNELVRIAVEAYFINDNFTRRLDLINVHNTLSIQKNSIFGEIEYPIFIYLIDKLAIKKHRIALSNFLDSHNIRSIDQLFNLKNIFDRSYYEFVLHKLCTKFFFQRDTRFSDETKSYDELRIEVLQFLCLENDTDRKKYVDEINSINTDNLVKKRMKQINQNKIFSDTKKILLENQEIWSENFNKYLSIKKFDREIYTYDLGRVSHDEILMRFSRMEDEFAKNPTYQQERIVLDDLLLSVTNELLFNTSYGLETYLSSRIRHGYSKNILTKPLFDLQLLSISESHTNHEFLINEYWDKKSDFSYDFLVFKNALSAFSLSINNKIDEINTKWIRIRSKNDIHGLFDYSKLIPQFMYILSTEINDFTSFYTFFIDFFWKYTADLLSAIRNRMELEIYDYYISRLNVLETELALLSSSSISDLVKEATTKINQSKSKIKVMLAEFSSAFVIESVEYNDFTADDTILTCIQLIEKIHPSFQDISFTRSCDKTKLFNGEFFPYFVDITNILINNAIEHSLFSNPKDISIEVSIKENSDAGYLEAIHPIALPNARYFLLSVKNNFNTKRIDYRLLRIKIDEIFAKLKQNKLKEYIQTEGGTGLAKIYNIMKYHFPTSYVLSYDIQINTFSFNIFFDYNPIKSREK